VTAIHLTNFATDTDPGAVPGYQTMRNTIIEMSVSK